MLKFSIIIPLDMTNDADYYTSTLGQKSRMPGSMPIPTAKSADSYLSTLQDDCDVCGANTYFLVPALIDLSEQPLIPTVAPAGKIKLEQTFQLEHFLPPGLLQRIMSLTYFRYGNYDNTNSRSCGSTKMSGHAMSYRESNRNCWESAFLQTFKSNTYGEISVWVWIEKDAPRDNYYAEKPSKSTFNTNKNHQNDKKSSAQIVETQGTVHVSVFGIVFVCQELLKKLNFYSDIVSNVLKSYSSLCHVTQAMVCPVCNMEERKVDFGEFSQSDLAAISKELNAISKLKMENGDIQRDALGCEISFEWTKRCRQRCPRQGCLVNADYLVMIPPNLLRETVQSPLDQALATINFLMEENVRLSGKPSAEIVNSVCKVGIGFCTKERFAKAKQSIAAGDNNCIQLDLVFLSVPKLISGAVVDINSDDARVPNMDNLFDDDNIFVVTSEHFICDPQTGTSNLVFPRGMNSANATPVFLIGSKYCYARQTVVV
jgi:hypothetical protein